MSTAREPVGQSEQPLMRWSFVRGHRILTCRIDARANRASYDLAILPHWDIKKASVETVQGLLAALRRHAAAVARLRAAGWTLVDYTA